MPVYEYICEANHRHEKMESFDAPAEQKCATCGITSRRMLSTPAVIFKGPGFYSTDNRTGSPSTSSSSSDTKSEGSGKEKPATVTDTSEPKAEASV